MALKIIRGRTLPIGVDLGTGSVKMAQLRTEQDKVELMAAGTVALPKRHKEDMAPRLDTMAKGIRQVLHTNDFKGRECILSLPAEATFVQHVRLPKLPAEETAKALQMELQGKLPYPVESAVIRHIAAGEVFGDGEPKQEVICIAAARRTLDAYLAMAGKAKLDVIGVNVEACAVVECFSRLFRRAADAGRTILFLDIGAASTQIVLSHGERIVFARNLLQGGRQLDQAVADGMRISLDQAHALRVDLLKGKHEGGQDEEVYRLLEQPINALADELTQCLRYYESVFRNQSVERSIFVGGQAYDKRLCQSIAQRLNLPAQIGDPLVRVERVQGAGLSTGLDRREPQPDWAVAIGLSLGALRAA